MRKMVKNGIWKLICAFVLCAGIVIVLVTCAKDDECKECTNAKGETKTLCGDELTEARLTPGVTCKK